MTTIRIKLPKIEEVNFALTVEEETMEVRGNALASGDDKLDKEYEDEIIRRLKNGDIWAWASVCVAAHWKGISGIDWLGNCSYKDEEDFKQSGGYYESMKQQSYDDLIAKLMALRNGKEKQLFHVTVEYANSVGPQTKDGYVMAESEKEARDWARKKVGGYPDFVKAWTMTAEPADSNGLDIYQFEQEDGHWDEPGYTTEEEEEEED